MARASIKDTSRSLDWVPYIYYPLRFQKNTIEAKAIINSDSKINTMTAIYVLKLGFRVCQTDVKA